jgi:hypothetical protein
MAVRFPNRRVLLLLAVLAVAGVVAYSIARGVTGTSDFKNPYRVARIFWETGELDIRREPRYPPTIRVMLAPLAALPLGVAAAVWTIVSVPAILFVPRLLERLSGIPVRAQTLAWLAVLMYVVDAFALGQAEPINLFLVTWGLVLARGAGAVAGASLIGLAGMIKVLPVVFWAVLVARGRVLAAAAGAVATAAASAALLVAAAGWDAGIESLAEWMRVLREGEGPWGLVATRNSLRENNEALPIVLARTLGDLDPALARNAVSIARLPLSVIWVVWLAVLTAMAAVWAACAWRARALPPERAWLAMFGLTSPLLLAATHIAWPHYFMWLVPTALALSARPWLLLGAAALGQLGMMIPVLRGLGCHTAIALVLFAVLALDVLARRR